MQYLFKRVLFFVLIVSGFSFGLGLYEPDSLSAAGKTTDSLTAVNDSLRKKSDIDSVVYASGRDSLIFFVSGKKMNVFGNGDLKYKTTQLKSGQIFVDFQTNNVDAEGIHVDTGKKPIVETPSLLDKGEEYKGTRMRYNFKTTRGYITFAATKADEASYSGAKINKIDKNTFFVENGIYTTCDAEEPHYGFYGKEMKVMQKQQMVAKWVWLTFENVPFPIPAPFAVVPLQSGRRSGIIAPAYGERTGYGKYFSHLGYYWAMSDYTDLSATTDLYTKGGYALNSTFQYASRYNFTGYVHAGFSDLEQGLTTDPGYSKSQQWELRVIHNQTLTPTSRFDANLQFMSSKSFYEQTTTDYSQLLRNEIYSNASYSKTWEEAGTNLSVNYTRRQAFNPNTEISEILPMVNFGKSTFYPFRPKGRVDDEKWYEMLGFSYNGQLQNTRNVKDGELKIRGGVKHDIGTYLSPKIGYFNFNPSFSYQERWYNKQIEKWAVRTSDSTDSVATRDVNKLSFVRTYNVGIGTSTKIYGIFQPQFAGIAAIRHIIQPSINYSFTPDFSKTKWGYFGRIKHINGREEVYSKYEREVYGGANQGESQLLTLGVGNIFEMKTMVDPTDTTSRESKYTLLNLNASTSYNFVADSLRLGDINLGYSTTIGSIISLNGNASYGVYAWNASGQDINKYLWNERKQLARLKYFSFSAGLNLSGERKEASPGQQISPDDAQPQYQRPQTYFPQDNRIYGGLYATENADFSIPWGLSLNYNYNLNKTNPSSISIYSTVSGSMNFNLTKAWKFSMTGSYDIREKQFSAPQITVTRDLHCWIMNFSWNPIGSYSGYRLEIRVKAPQLQDLKLTKTDRFFSGRW